MKVFCRSVLFLMIINSVVLLADVPTYTVKRTTSPILVDGVLDEADWTSAESVGNFKFPWYKTGEKEQTEVKILWDDNFIYLAYKSNDKHIWAEVYNFNSTKPFFSGSDDTVEFFWNPRPEKHSMYNIFEMSCIGNLLCVYNNLEQGFFNKRECRIMPPHIAQMINGTLNNDEDIDTGWILEVAVRFSDYTEIFDGSTPKDGETWKIGLNRCGGQTDYQYSQWSPSQTERPNFHVYKDFGKIVFSMKPVR